MINMQESVCGRQGQIQGGLEEAGSFPPQPCPFLAFSSVCFSAFPWGLTLRMKSMKSELRYSQFRTPVVSGLSPDSSGLQRACASVSLPVWCGWHTQTLGGPLLAVLEMK